MTQHIRHSTLRPIGRGTLHTDPTSHDARQESLRIWATSRRAVRGGAPSEGSPASRRASAPRR